MKLLVLPILLHALTSLCLVKSVSAFVASNSKQNHGYIHHRTMAVVASEKKSFLQDLGDIFNKLDDVVDDFVYKRMGAGEQWYGKRKNNPSGKFDGDYSGMGISDYMRIEAAKIQKEEFERKRQLKRQMEEERK